MITELSLLSTQPRRTFWSWLRGVTRYFDHGDDALDVNRVERLQPLSMRHRGLEEPLLSPYAGKAEPARGDVLLFPIHGEALLVRLADVLRRRLAQQGPDHDPLLLTISRSPGSRLLIDGAAYVDYLSDLSTYRAAVEAVPDTRVIVETSDFDTLVRFIVQYLADRLSEPAATEVTS
ncbi:hypothetical protein [Bradyrhizobium sp. Ai1a-2]|uniref:hypothetical protein n=1 Tax=Bradyrhizobium sp. Ai1a-2 TaxID=196490 RepID=UPI0004093BEF|nr:hypothetical protein [Bradyrhizobium sp. Ai1a-2]